MLPIAPIKETVRHLKNKGIAGNGRNTRIYLEKSERFTPNIYVGEYGVLLGAVGLAFDRNAMLKTLAYYAVFTPLSTLSGEYLAETLMWNEYIVTILNMLANFILMKKYKIV